MKKICIIGSNISGLYNALKYIDYDCKIDIYDKKSEIILNTIDNYKYNLYNDNHKNYINLLKKFNIEGYKLDIKFNDRLYNIINIVIDKLKSLPVNMSSSCNFLNLCTKFLNNYDLEYIQNELNNNNILNYINGTDFLNIYNNDLNKTLNYYYLTNENINLLINRIQKYLIDKKVIFNFNYNINNIEYENNKFIINNIKNYDYIICTLSKKNLINLNIWNNKNINILSNSITNVNMYYIKELIDNFININLNINNIEKKNYIKNLLLNKLHIIYPQNDNKNNLISLWNTNIDTILNDKNNKFNNYLLKNKIKFLFNNKFFICSNSYCKNNIFLNYLLELIDNTNFIKKKF
jgi:hypothetical protein